MRPPTARRVPLKQAQVERFDTSDLRPPPSDPLSSPCRLLRDCPSLAAGANEAPVVILRVSPCPAPARFAFAGEILAIARRAALRSSLGTEDAEDCALAFVGRVLLDDGEAALRPPGSSPEASGFCPAWVWRCAVNHACNVRRRQRQLAEAERPWPEIENTEGGVAPWDPPADTPGPEALLLRRQASEAVRRAIGRLSSDSGAAFLRHYVGGECVRDVASAAGRTPHAVEQSLLRSRVRLRDLLERQGLGAEVLRLAFALAPEADPARPASLPALGGDE